MYKSMVLMALIALKTLQMRVNVAMETFTCLDCRAPSLNLQTSHHISFFSHWISGWSFKKIKGEKLHVILVLLVTLLARGEVASDRLTPFFSFFSFWSAQETSSKELT